MEKIEIYLTPTCGFCRMAKQLLDKKGVKYEQIRIDLAPEKREEMIDRSKQRTVPQIFFAGKHIGGCDELYELEMKGQLDTLLKPFLTNE